MNTKNAALKISADQTTDVISELTLRMVELIPVMLSLWEQNL